MSQNFEQEQPKEPRRGVFARVFGKGSAPVDGPEPEADSEAESEQAPAFDGPHLICGPDCPGHPLPIGGLFALGRPAGPAAPSAKRAWSPVFADKIGKGDLVGMPAGAFGGRERELKVCEIRTHEGQVEDPLAPYVTLLMVDTETGEVFSPTVSVNAGFRVAPAVPDSPAFLGGGV
jgi:hypothetical protein